MFKFADLQLGELQPFLVLHAMQRIFLVPLLALLATQKGVSAVRCVIARCKCFYLRSPRTTPPILKG